MRDDGGGGTPGASPRQPLVGTYRGASTLHIFQLADGSTITVGDREEGVEVMRMTGGSRTRRSKGRKNRTRTRRY